jgi:hypothetical protein
MKRTATIKERFADEVEEASERFGDHEGLDTSRVLRWLANFDDEHLPLAVRVLQGIRYYAASQIRAMARELVTIVMADFEGLDPKDVYFVHVGGLGSSSGIIMRVVRDLKESKDARIISMVDLEKLPTGEGSVLVFIDDFSGTGEQLKEWWERVEPLVRPKNACIVVALLVMNGRAREEIEGFADCLFCIDELKDQMNVLSEDSTQFDEGDKKTLKKYCQETGCEPVYVHGYGQCGLLVAFKHGCPDDSLPVLWYESEHWDYLFKRSAI